jgi:hypothetical protein
LLLQQTLRVFGEVLEQLLNARDVVGRFCECAGELLDRGIAIELQRIEVAAMSGLILVTVQNLRLGLDLQAAQLLLQTDDGTRQLAEVEVDRAQLLLQARAGNAGLTGDVEQLIEQVRVHAGHLGTLGLAHRLAAGGYRHGRRGCLIASAFGQARQCHRDGDRSTCRFFVCGAINPRSSVYVRCSFTVRSNVCVRRGFSLRRHFSGLGESFMRRLTGELTAQLDVLMLI